MLKSILNFIKKKMVIIAVLILIQLFTFFFLINELSQYFVASYTILIILSGLASIYIINKPDNASYKLLWLLVILTIPIFGGLFYLLFGGQKVPKELRQRDLQAHIDVNKILKQNDKIMDDLKEYDKVAYKQANYIWNRAKFPIYQHTKTVYFKSGEEKFAQMLQEIEKAKRFIFLEYFIIEEGIMWGQILDLLVVKAKEGVDVRLMYDDGGCINKLPDHYDKKMKELGIKAKVFNPIKARIALQMNNRDHRKIFVVDGHIAMTGGVNLADEYINEQKRFGHWKDSAVMLEGEAVWSFTLMFLQFWNYDEKDKDDFTAFQAIKDEQNDIENDGYVQPYSDSPTDEENVGENTHINMINSANDYIYAMTPYLVVDDETKLALMLAAKNGVDVRILCPHIPDKWYVFEITQSNYRELIESGVKIYEYTPGFVHSKTIVSDDKMAIVGTVNMDYRSYYLHYECGVWFYRSSVVLDVKQDYLETLKVSHQVTLEECLQIKWYRKIFRAVIKVFAPIF